VIDDGARSSERDERARVGRVLFLLALLLAALGSAADGLAGVIRDLGIGLLWSVATSGALTGWVMARLRLPGWLRGVMLSLFGVTVVFVRVGRLGGDLMAMLRASLSLYWGAWRWFLGASSPDWTPTLLAVLELRSGVGALLARWSDWMLTLMTDSPTFDPAATALVWGLAMWIVAVWAGWQARCHQPLPGLTPAVTLLISTLYYAGAKPFSLLPLLGATLSFMALDRYMAREHHWRTARIKFSRDIWASLVIKTSILSLALVIVAALMSSISMQRVIELGSRFGGERADGVDVLADSLGVEQRLAPARESGPARDTTAFDSVRVGGLPRRHLLSAGPDLSEQVVMIIRTGDSAPRTPEREAERSPTRYYWRSLTYDRYTGRGWAAGSTDIVEYGAGQQTISVTLASHRIMRQEVQIARDVGDLIHVAGALLAVDRDYSVAWRSHADAFGAMVQADAYRADSLLPVSSEEQLRSAGSDYPDWVRSRYLALPDTVPARVLSLARDLTATEPTPYDRALAIETYLRAFPYTLDVSTPPYDRDVADYFLFDLREGYCDYYATAMVVLARAAGLPARLVVGYATGNYDAGSGQYVVTEDQAHAWAEVYFPGYGWVEFEPTAALPSIERLSKTAPLAWPEPEGALGAAITGQNASRRTWWPVALGGLASLALAGVVWAAVDDWRLRHLRPATVAAVLYRRLQRHGRRLAAPMRAGDTPYEFGASLTEWVTERIRDGRWAEMAASAGQDVRDLVDLYVQASYSPLPPDDTDRASAVRAWRRLQRWLWLAWVRRPSRFAKPLGSDVAIVPPATTRPEPVSRRW
jgi:transglutaminase-like putative cysteine protease